MVNTVTINSKITIKITVLSFSLKSSAFSSPSKSVFAAAVTPLKDKSIKNSSNIALLNDIFLFSFFESGLHCQFPWIYKTTCDSAKITRFYPASNFVAIVYHLSRFVYKLNIHSSKQHKPLFHGIANEEKANPYPCGIMRYANRAFKSHFYLKWINFRVDKISRNWPKYAKIAKINPSKTQDCREHHHG